MTRWPPPLSSPGARGIGTVDVVVSTHSGQADPALLEQLQTYFQSRREIAVDVQVRAPEQVKVDVTVRIQPAEGSDRETVAAGVEAAVRNWFPASAWASRCCWHSCTAWSFPAAGWPTASWPHRLTMWRSPPTS